MIYNLYNNAKSCVKLGDKKSDECFPCNIGLRQGENFSPLLFAIYLNDFELTLSKSYTGLDTFSKNVKYYLSDDDVELFLKRYCLLYADDTIVLAESDKELQLVLNYVKNYCNDWNLTVNTSKTKIIIFSKGKIRKKPVFLFW